MLSLFEGSPDKETRGFPHQEHALTGVSVECRFHCAREREVSFVSGRLEPRTTRAFTTTCALIPLGSSARRTCDYWATSLPNGWSVMFWMGVHFCGFCFRRTPTALERLLDETCWRKMSASFAYMNSRRLSALHWTTSVRSARCEPGRRVTSTL